MRGFSCNVRPQLATRHLVTPMVHSAPPHAPDRSLDRRRRPFRLALAAALTASAIAQAPVSPPLPEMTVELSVDGSTWLSQLDGSAGFSFVRCNTLPSAAAGWYIALAHAEVVNPAYLQLPASLHSIGPSRVQLGSLTAAFEPHDIGAYMQGFEIEGTPEAGMATLRRMLEIDGQANPAAVETGGEPFYLTDPLAPVYGHMNNHGWLFEPGSKAFNLDAILQDAVWERVQDEYQGSQKNFFSGPKWKEIRFAAGVDLYITLIAVRGPGIEPADGVTPPGTPPNLGGDYPRFPPKFAKSSSAKIGFVGGGGTHFLPQWAPNVQVPIYTVKQGHTVQLPMSGYLPGMQVALCAEDLQERYEIPVDWSDFGKVDVTVPQGATPNAFYRIKYYRHQIEGPNGPTYTNWQSIPANRRPRIHVVPDLP